MKFRGHRGFNTESSSPESPVCTTASHYLKMTRQMVVYKSVWTERQKKEQRSAISMTGLRSRFSEGPRAFAGSALSECYFLVLIIGLNIKLIVLLLIFFLIIIILLLFLLVILLLLILLILLFLLLILLLL